MAETIFKATPRTVFQGTDDQSTQAQDVVAEARPQHFPIFPLYAAQGPEDVQSGTPTELLTMYGADTFDLRSPYATHATAFAKEVMSKGNRIFVKRLRPEDAGSPASLRLSLDVLSTQVPVYERNDDGTYVLGEDNAPVATGQTVSGFKLKWVVEEIKADKNGNDTFGVGTQVAGDQVDATAGTQSKRYPIIDLRVPYFGAGGANKGIRLWSPLASGNNAFDTRLLTGQKVYPFNIACIARADADSSPKAVTNNDGAQFMTLTFKPGFIDKNYDNQMYVGTQFLNAYQSLLSKTAAPVYGPFGEIEVYDDNVALLLALFYAEESKYIGEFSDLTGEKDEQYRLNILSAQTSTGVPYQSMVIVSGTDNSLRLTENTNIYAIGGSDGTMSNDKFDALVKDFCQEFADPTSPLKDIARYPFRCIYDSGYSLETKHALCNILALRKDTYPVLGTHVVGGPKTTAAQDSAMCVSLLATLQMYPESTDFNTPVMRGMIIGRSGVLLNSQYTGRLPLTLELASYSAEFMGADNGKWVPGMAFDISPRNQVRLFSDVSSTFTSDDVRNKDWDNGMCWPEAFDRRNDYFPAWQTVYNRDDSILNGFFSMAAICELEYIGELARRMFSGRQDLSAAQLVAGINKFVNDQVEGKFDARFVIVPNAFITGADEKRGYSWSLQIVIYGPNMVTVQTLSIVSKRIEELTA
jgi:hypothetical protein